MAKKADNELQEAEAAAAVEATEKLEELVETEAMAEAIVDAENEIDAEAAGEQKAAKAGKRSTKGIEESKAKAEKIEHQQHREADKTEVEAKPKQPVTPTRSRLERRAKGYRKAADQIEQDKLYGLKPALELAVKTSPVKFDATVELHVNLSVDPRHADQNIRDSFVLPSGTGKTVRVAVFADDAIKGADLSGIEAITKALDKGTIDFDILIAAPTNMPKLGKYARLLGPRGLMPNPKSGTVTTDLDKAVTEAKAGRVEYRVDSTGIIHLGIGKVSFGADKLLANAEAVFTSLKSNKPASVKGTYIKNIHLATTMGPSIPVDSATV